MLQRTFDRVCTCWSISRYGKRAELLACHITDQFRNGMIDDAALFENAMWLEQHAGTASHQQEA
jgi:hypothetical protein